MSLLNDYDTSFIIDWPEWKNKHIDDVPIKTKLILEWFNQSPNQINSTCMNINHISAELIDGKHKIETDRIAAF